MSFPERLRELRKQADFSQRELAERVGVDFTYLSKIENGIMAPPSQNVIRKVVHELAAKLNMDETKLADELITLAGKVPSDVAELLKNPAALAHLRSFTENIEGKTGGSGRKRKV